MMDLIEILKKDGCTEVEAEKHLKKGTVIFEAEDLKKNFNTYMTEWDIGEDEQTAYREMLEQKKLLPDWSIVEHDGQIYFIAYCL